MNVAELRAGDGRGLLNGDGQRLLRRAVPLAADSGMAYVPAVVGVPASVAVPSPLSVKVTPGGTLDQPKLGAG